MPWVSISLTCRIATSVRVAREIDWGFLDRRFASVCMPGPGQPGLQTRLVAGLFNLKHMHNLSDEVLCARWLENPYYQFFCGELSYCHRLPFDRSSLTHWRHRLGAELPIAPPLKSPERAVASSPPRASAQAPGRHRSHGARALRRITAIVSFLNPEPTLTLGGGNWS